MAFYSEDELMKMSGFTEDMIREDSFNGRNGIHRLSAIFEDYMGVEFRKMEEEQRKESINQLIFRLKTSELPPNRIYVDDYSVEADWYPPLGLVLNSKEDYLKLVINFRRYISSLLFARGIVNLGMGFDDPDIDESGRVKDFNRIMGVRTKVDMMDVSREVPFNVEIMS